MQWMNAARFIGPGSIELERVQRPSPGPSQVRIALEGTGVCASNLPLWKGASWLQYPLGPGSGGHEGWGIVDQVGRDVDPKLEGTRVAALSYNAYAEFDLADARHVVPLSRALSEQPFPGEALGCAVNIFRRSAIEPGQVVAVVGIGFLGALLTRLASRAGARVIAISRRAHALREAERMGAHATLSSSLARADVVSRVWDLTEGRGCERVIEATGKQEPLDLSAELIREGGRLVIAGYHQDGPRTVNMQLWNWRGIDVINAHERDPMVSLRGMREAVELVESGALAPQRLYSEYRLSDLGGALSATDARPGTFMKALVRTGDLS